MSHYASPEAYREALAAALETARLVDGVVRIDGLAFLPSRLGRAGIDPWDALASLAGVLVGLGIVMHTSPEQPAPDPAISTASVCMVPGCGCRPYEIEPAVNQNRGEVSLADLMLAADTLEQEVQEVQEPEPPADSAASAGKPCARRIGPSTWCTRAGGDHHEPIDCAGPPERVIPPADFGPRRTR